eukprot:3785654-Rhodomonas_salina.2
MSAYATSSTRIVCRSSSAGLVHLWMQPHHTQFPRNPYTNTAAVHRPKRDDLCAMMVYLTRKELRAGSGPQQHTDSGACSTKPTRIPKSWCIMDNQAPVQ